MYKIVLIIFGFLLFNFNAIASDSNPVYGDAISSLLAESNLIEATDCAIVFFNLSKNDVTHNNYLKSINLLYYCYVRRNKYSDALGFLFKELDSNIGVQNGLNEMYISYYIGLLYKDINDIDNALEYFLKVSEMLDMLTLKEITDVEKIHSYNVLYTDLAIILISIDPERSLHYFIEAKKYAEETMDLVLIADAYLNLGWANVELENFSIAETYLDSALVLFEFKSSIKGRASVFLERGLILKSRNNNIRALQLFVNSYKLLFETSTVLSHSYFLKQKTLKLLSSTYSNLDNSDRALKYAIENFELAKEYKDTNNLAENAKVLGEIYELKGKESLALQYYKLSNEYHQIIQEESSKVKILKKEYDFQISKSEHKLISAVLDVKDRNSKIFILLLILCSFGIVSYFIVRKMQFIFLDQSQTIEKKNKIILNKTQSMADLSLVNISKNQILDYFKEKLQSIYNDSNIKSPELKKLIFQLKKSVNKEEEWIRFRKFHMELEPSFYQTIQCRWPNLSNSDIRHCTLMKLKMSNKDAADVLGISPKSVQMARYRLKMKLNYDSQESLKIFLASI